MVSLNNKSKEKMGYGILILQIFIAILVMFYSTGLSTGANVYLFALAMVILPIIPAFILITPFKNRKSLGIILGILIFLGFLFFLLLNSGEVLELGLIFIYLIGLISSVIIIIDGEEVPQNNIVYVVNSNNQNNFCSSCGEKLEPNSSFCSSCGKKL